MSKQKLEYIIIALSAVFVVLLAFFLYVLAKPVPVPLGPENMIDISDIEPMESKGSTEPVITIPIENEEYLEVEEFDSTEEYEKWVDNLTGKKKEKSKEEQKTEKKKDTSKVETKKKKSEKKNSKKKTEENKSGKKKKKNSK